MYRMQKKETEHIFGRFRISLDVDFVGMQIFYPWYPTSQ